MLKSIHLTLISSQAYQTGIRCASASTVDPEGVISPSECNHEVGKCQLEALEVHGVQRQHRRKHGGQDNRSATSSRLQVIAVEPLGHWNQVCNNARAYHGECKISNIIVRVRIAHRYHRSASEVRGDIKTGDEVQV